MKILHTVESYTPTVNGMQEVVKQISENLVKLGHNVTIATKKNTLRKENIINGVKIVDFDISGNFSSGLKGEIEEYKNFVLRSDFDIVTNFAAQQWATDILLPILPQIKAKKVFVPTGFSGFYIPQFREYFENMKQWMKNYDMNVFLSYDYRDINFAKQNNITKNIVIPNGANKEEFLKNYKIDIRKKLNISQNHFLILNVSSHTGLKGHIEAIKIFEKAKIKDCTFVIAGNTLETTKNKLKLKQILKKIIFFILNKKISTGCSQICIDNMQKFNSSKKRKTDDKRLIVSSFTREETVCLYQQSDLFLFPSNIECSPIVLFEAMASQTPFLVTDVGNSKEIIDWSQGGMLLPTKIDKKGYSKVDINKASKILTNIYYNKEILNKLKKSGFNSWLENFSWEKISKDYEKMYCKLLGVKC